MESVFVMNLFEAVSSGGRFLPRFIVLLFLDSVLLQIDSVDSLRGRVFDPQLLRRLAYGHVMDVDLDNEVPAQLVIAEIIIFDHGFI